METQGYDTSRLYNSDDGRFGCYGCPTCSCPDGKNLGDTWYHEYQQQSNIDENTAKCVQCECKEDGHGNYTSCNYGIDEYPVGSKTCGGSSTTTEISCHDAFAVSRMLHVVL